MTVRIARFEDAPAMARVMVDTYGPGHRGQVPEEYLTQKYADWGYDVSQRAWERALREIEGDPGSRECVYVAVDDHGDVVGVCMGTPTEYSQFAEEPEATGEIGCLYVLPEHQGRGHGRRLVEATAAHLARHGMTALLIRCLETGAPARAFYEALGGQNVGHVDQEEYGHTIREVVYLWRDTRALAAEGGETASYAPGGRDRATPSRDEELAMATLTEQTPFRQTGYLVVPNLFTAEECHRLNERAQAMVEGRAPLGERNAVRLEPDAEERGLVTDANRYALLFKIGHRMQATDPVFRDAACHPRVVAVLQELIGPDVKCVQTMYIDKPPGIGVGQPYHQDSHYLKTDPDTLMAVWIALDDADVENGCLHVIPGSQGEPVYPHETPVDPAQRTIYIEVHSARERAEVAVPLPRGSGVFFPGHMLHRSGNNRSDRTRRAFVAHYADARSRWLRQDDPNHPFLLVCGREYPGGL